MRECCKTGSNNKSNGITKWFNYILYAILIIIIFGAVLLHLKGSVE